MRINETSEDDLRRSQLGDDLLMALISYLYKKPAEQKLPLLQLKNRDMAYVRVDDLDIPRIFHDVLIAFAERRDADPSGSVRKVSAQNGIRFILTIYLSINDVETQTYRSIYNAMYANDRRETFRHEVQHILDIKRFRDKSAVKSTMSNNNYQDYYNSPLELNAYFHNVAEPILNQLRFIQKHPDVFELVERLPDDFRAFLANRLAHLYGAHRAFWKHLTDDNKRRVISRLKRLYDLYQDTYGACVEKHRLSQQQERAVDAALGDVDINTSDA